MCHYYVRRGSDAAVFEYEKGDSAYISRVFNLANLANLESFAKLYFSENFDTSKVGIAFQLLTTSLQLVDERAKSVSDYYQYRVYTRTPGQPETH